MKTQFSISAISSIIQPPYAAELLIKLEFLIVEFKSPLITPPQYLALLLIKFEFEITLTPLLLNIIPPLSFA